jgi:hypothetical protein
MLGYLKIAGAGLVVASLIFLGWKANGWRIKSAQAEVLQVELRNEMERRVRADADRLGLQIKLSEAEARIGSGVRIVTKTIKQYVKDAPDCRITRPVSDGLRDLRAGSLPSTAPDPTLARATP